MDNNVTAGIILIGDELLSGRTQDTNLGTIARWLEPLGVQVGEARIVADDADVISSTVRDFSERFDYVFTTGGIGPTHDDITADCIAAAFGLGILRPLRVWAVVGRSLFQAGAMLIGNSGDFVNLAGRVGGVEARVEDVSAMHASKRTAFSIARNELTQVDAFQTALNLQDVQTQLEIQFSMTARLSGLSLANYI